MEEKEVDDVGPSRHITSPHDIHLISADEVNDNSENKWTTFSIADDQHVIKTAIVIAKADQQILMFLTGSAAKVEVDEEIKERIEKGFQFLKAIFGISVVLPSLSKVGVMPIVAGWKALKVLPALSDVERASISIPASIVVNTAELLGRYNCLDGRAFVEDMLDMFPLTKSDQEMVRLSSFTDYGKIVKH